MKNKKYCCEFFAEAVKEETIGYAGKNDQTEWFITESYHIYYCPFCGAFIKGKGFGEYDKKYPPDRFRVNKTT